MRGENVSGKERIGAKKKMLPFVQSPDWATHPREIKLLKDTSRDCRVKAPSQSMPFGRSKHLFLCAFCRLPEQPNVTKLFQGDKCTKLLNNLVGVYSIAQDREKLKFIMQISELFHFHVHINFFTTICTLRLNSTSFLIERQLTRKIFIVTFSAIRW